MDVPQRRPHHPPAPTTHRRLGRPRHHSHLRNRRPRPDQHRAPRRRRAGGTSQPDADSSSPSMSETIHVSRFPDPTLPEHTLILLRHAKSDWSGHEADIARPLAKRGRRQAPDAGRWLATNIDSIDLAVVSPASRARSTWDLVSVRLDAPTGARIADR